MPQRDVWKEIAEEDRRDGFGWRHDGFGAWTTEAIFAKLSELGIASDPEQFRRDALAAGDVRPLAKAWKKLAHADESWDDFPYLTPTELWRRLLPDVPCETIALDDLLHACGTLGEPGGDRPAAAEEAGRRALQLADIVRNRYAAAPLEVIDRWGRQRSVDLAEEIVDLPDALQTEGLHDRAVAVARAWAPLLGSERLRGEVAYLFAREGKRQEAEAQIAEIERDLPDSLQIRMAVAATWEELGELDRALRAYEVAERMAELVDDIDWVLESKAFCLEDMGRVEEARKIRADAGLPEPGTEPVDEGDESDEPWPELPPVVAPPHDPRGQAPPPPLKADAKVGRNEPCPCGSGKKHKKCCGK